MLRHAFVTAALDAGVPLRDVQEAASHADPRTTMRYDRARASLDRHATYIVAAYVAGAAGNERRADTCLAWQMSAGLVRGSLIPGTMSALVSTVTAVDSTRRQLHQFELEPEARDWLGSLSDSDYKRVHEVCGMLAEKGTSLGGPWSDHLAGQVWELRLRLAQVAVRVTYWCRPDGVIVLPDRVPQDPPARPAADRPGSTGAADLRARPLRPGKPGVREAGVMTGYHTRWVLPEADAEDPERIAIRQALAFGKAVYDRRTALGLTIAEVALRAGTTADEIECIEEGGTEPTLSLLRRLAAALDADVRITAGDDLGSLEFEAHAA